MGQLSRGKWDRCPGEVGNCEALPDVEVFQRQASVLLGARFLGVTRLDVLERDEPEWNALGARAPSFYKKNSVRLTHTVRFSRRLPGYWSRA